MNKIIRYILCACWALMCSGLFGEPLNSRNVTSCLSLVDDFIDDYSHYFNYQMEIAGVMGRVYDDDTIFVQKGSDRISIQILFKNEVFIRIFIEKDTRQDSSDGFLSFDYKSRFGFQTFYSKSYDIGDQYEIRYILRGLFEALGYD